ncbi:uncharacterized protein OCT59_000210 [Rhizophagus irregularis]|uniref:uncharacterized protein n=1 Tax=Rhizophagus irregularis TaxID=588596 RepID=UPI0033339EA4|nr:hypothetical protein OCT59_000210 [Rhizophagus irregularis]
MDGSDNFTDSRLFKVLGGYVGLAGIAIAMIFVAFIIFIFIVRIIQYPHLRQQIIDHITSKSTRSIHTRILKMIVFFLFTAGTDSELIFLSADYHDSFNGFNDIELFMELDEQVISIGIIAPKRVIKEVEAPSFKLADLFSNIGGYLSIWVIFAFLFGGKRANPFGFVTRFVFIKQDREKLLKELEKMKNDRKSKISTLEREVDNATETNSPSNQDELRNLLARYYVDMDFYEHAIKSLGV